MIDVSELIDDPDFASAFELIRSSGGFENEGEYVAAPGQPEKRIGVVQPAKAEDVAQFLPEGERANRAITVYCRQELRHSDGEGADSDAILWNGQRWRVIGVRNWSGEGFWQATAVGIAG
ncbi:MAG: hypothetical protein FWD77_03775 [Betaproteobacteria bacterium]|nr:hypothetical protein [Betaproteobacteria bacterium]